MKSRPSTNGECCLPAIWTYATNTVTGDSRFLQIPRLFAPMLDAAYLCENVGVFEGASLSALACREGPTPSCPLAAIMRATSGMDIVVPDISHTNFAEIARGVEETIDSEGYDLLLCHLRRDAERERHELAC